MYNYSQPIIDNVAEAVAGINASLAVKIFGNDLEKLDELADSVYNILGTVDGVKDLGIMRNIGQPELSIILDEQKMGIYGVTASDANSVIEMAIGGKSASIFYHPPPPFTRKKKNSLSVSGIPNNTATMKLLSARFACLPSTVQKCG